MVRRVVEAVEGRVGAMVGVLDVAPQKKCVVDSSGKQAG